jgi:hypothetical protein
VLAQRRRDGSPVESSGQVAGRKPRRSRALLACQQDTDEACRSRPGAACCLPGLRAKARPGRKAAPSPDSTIPPLWGEKAAHQRTLNRLKRAPTHRSGRNGGAWSTHRPGELPGHRAANRGRAPAATLAPPLLACRQPTRPSAETTLHDCERHKRRRCPPARLSSAHAEPAQPHAPRPPSRRDATASPVRGSGPYARTRTGRARGHPSRSHAGPHQGHFGSLRRVAAGPAGRKHPATAPSW